MLMLWMLLLSIQSPAFAEDTLSCLSSSGGEFELPVKEHMAVVQEKGETLESEASLAPGSFLVTLQDKEAPVRSAFVGHPTAAAGAKLLQGNHEWGCRRSDGPLPIAPKRTTNYLICFLDEAVYTKGEPSEAKRQLPRMAPVLGRSIPKILEAANEKYSYRLALDDLNHVDGFRLDLKDKESGATTSFVGPASTLHSTVILALTQGDKAQDAKFLRLGCQFTNTLENIKGVK